MEDNEFFMLKERLVGIEVKLEQLCTEHPSCKADIYNIVEQLAKLSASVSSAHKRIDEFRRDVCFAIMASTTIVGIFATILTWALGGR